MENYEIKHGKIFVAAIAKIKMHVNNASKSKVRSKNAKSMSTEALESS